MKQIIGMLLPVLLLAGCSAVFDARISGRVEEYDDVQEAYVGLEDAFVYVYFEDSNRQEDFQQWDEAGELPHITQTTRYITDAKTNDDGEYTLGRFLWESTSPAFGKTGDRLQMYFSVGNEGELYNMDQQHFIFSEIDTRIRLELDTNG